MNDDDRRAEVGAHRRRLRGFGYHLIGYFAVMIVLIPVNVISDPQRPWFLLPMIGWGAVLGLHAAFAMSLLRRLFQGRPK